VTYVYDFDHPHSLPLSDVAAIVGGKAANIAVMVNDLHLPVPPGFTISTDACRRYLSGGWPDGLDGEIRDHIAHIEESVGRRFGDPTDPLLVSVRSGAPVSMPGMMDTILNLGLTEATAEGLAAASGDLRFAEACRERFTTTYRDIVGEDAPEDPWQQLRGAVEAVFRSWNGERARSYRAMEGISDGLGTGVTVQAMVFGNRGPDSATGVVFTRNPATGERVLYGDVMFDAQGEDVVAGTHLTQPISALDQSMPAVAAELRGYAEALERHYTDVCDIEFTIEGGRLWMLQTRIGKRSPQASLRIAIDMAEDPDFPLTREEAVRRVGRYLADPPKVAENRPAGTVALTVGLGASPGVAWGEIATTPEDAVSMADSGRRVILVRRETSPDDVHGMARAAGILTATGGLACHAAVVARGWGIPAVVGAADVEVGPDRVSIAGRRFLSGEVLTVDGATGEVFAGAVAGGEGVMAEALTLRSWADQLGIDIARADEQGRPPEGVPPTPFATAAGPATRQALMRTLYIKGFAGAGDLAAACFATPDEAAAVLDAMVADGIVEMAGETFTLSADGKSLSAEVLASDRARWGAKSAADALDAFLPLDQRVKDVVTAWQVRDDDGEQVLNDHSDLDHDSAVLADLASLHEDVAAWLDRSSDSLARLAAYAARLERAAGMVAAGEHRYIASPTVDSYHSVWFELHEELILLAGRNRADEVAAGRA